METKQALLVMVHGSPRPIANADMFRVVETVKGRGAFPIVEVGFMECNEPTIPEAIAACVAQGATEIIAVPYFLHTGTHVADDLPTLIEEAIALYPDVTFRMGDYLGRSDRLTDILTDRTQTALSP
jgi:sirohydrochlorin ferrochelatase